MMFRAILLAVGIGCAGSNAEQEGDAQPYEYTGVRDPFPVKKTDPVVPPAASPAPESPKVDPCAAPCAIYQSSDAKCDQLSEACDRMFQAQGHMRGETCTKKEAACAQTARLKAHLGNCSCG